MEGHMEKFKNTSVFTMLKNVQEFLKFLYHFSLIFFQNVERRQTRSTFVLLRLYPRTSFPGELYPRTLPLTFHITISHGCSFFFFWANKKDSFNWSNVVHPESWYGDHWHWTTLAGSNHKVMYMYLEAHAHALRSRTTSFFWVLTTIYLGKWQPVSRGLNLLNTVSWTSRVATCLSWSV